MGKSNSTWLLRIALAAALPGSTAYAGTAYADAELKLDVVFSGNPNLMLPASLGDITPFKDGFGLHEEKAEWEAWLTYTQWHLNIFSEANAFSPPTSRSISAVVASRGQIFELYNDPFISNRDEVVKITMSASGFLTANASLGGAASAKANYSIYAYGSSDEDEGGLFEPPYPPSIIYPPEFVFDIEKEIGYNFTLSPGEHYYITLRDASVKTFAYVPEPQSWMLMISGFAIIGTGLRRQRLRANADARNSLIDARP